MLATEIEIGGESRPVAFPAHALREIERMMGGQSFYRIDYMTYEFRIAMAYAGLKWGLYKGDGKEPRPTFNELQVADWVGTDIQDDSISGQLLKILNDWMPKPKKEVAGGSPAAQ